MDAQTTNLLARAADDEAALPLVGLPEVPFGQHAQGAIEKLIKALINEHGKTFPFSHDLDVLTRALANVGESLPPVPIDVDALTDYAMDLRYGDIGHLPPLDRPACIETVQLIRAHVEARIRALTPNPPTP